MTPEWLYAKIMQSPLIAFDTETTGLDWRHNTICGYVFTFAPGDTIYLPVRHASGNLENVEEFERAIKDAAKHANTTWIMHNAPFDLMFCAKHGIDFTGRIHDTGVMAPMVNEYESYYSLENLCKVHNCEVQKDVDIYRYMADKFDCEPSKDLMSRFWELPGDDQYAANYAITDGDATLELYYKLRDKISDQELEECWAVESTLTPILHRITRRGMKIDQQRLEEVIHLGRLELKNAEMALPDDLNTRSPIQMQKLFTDAGIDDWPETEKGRASFPAKWLAKSELGRKVLTAREWRTLFDTFLEPMRDKHLYHGRVHTSYAQLRNDEHGTISGRLSSYEPNLQNLTSVDRHPEQGKLLRSIFVPDAGYRLYEVDYSQCEVRLAAHVGKIASWIQGYNADPPLDAHSVVAQITGLPRVNAKTVNLAILLGAGKDKAIDMLGVPYEQGEAILEQYHERFPEIRALRKAVSEKFVRRGYLRSVLGRRYRLKDSSQGYTGLSRILQGGNADVTKLALTLVDQIPEVTLLNTVHDSLVFQTQDEKAIDRVVEAMTDYINDRFRLRAPLTVDVKSGPNWGAME